ncbi:hypothetical protein LTR66_014995, partial [Elasticomyces elasticus]
MAPAESSHSAGILKADSHETASPRSLTAVNEVESPRVTPKAVSIAPNPSTISPLMLGSQKDVDLFELERQSSPRQLRAKGPFTKRRSSKLSVSLANQSRESLVESLKSAQTEEEHSHYHAHHKSLVEQVTTWMKAEQHKRAQKKAKRNQARGVTSVSHNPVDGPSTSSERRGSASSEDISFGTLEQILKESLSLSPRFRRRPGSLRRKTSVRKLMKNASSTNLASSDTEYYDGDVLVPSTDAWLDNSRTLAYTGGAATPSDDLRRSQTKDKEAWDRFKYEIVRLTHTLRLKGWRRVPMDASENIEVERLSGALTNAVYVIAPPKELPPRQSQRQQGSSGNGSVVAPTRPPPKLLLRIYGPQVEHLIDREAELQILRRLARKRIGPRLLGTFGNGRFEEFFHARTLTPEDIRDVDTSQQIAKRMRELHEGIDLLEQERDDGAFVWRNWDKWVTRVEEIVTWLDEQITTQTPGTKSKGLDAWKARGHVCGVEWPVFRQVVEKYRKWLDEQYGGSQKLRQQLVFAHNDTQYGNILRLLPSGTSPLLLPRNSHRQLVVIDFEYASANLPGLEFANHFTEWCYNYHNVDKAYACNTANYPKPEEQDRFVRAYVRHRPHFSGGANEDTSKPAPQKTDTDSAAPPRPAGPSHSISHFMLDARAPAGAPISSTDIDAAELAAEDAE